MFEIRIHKKHRVMLPPEWRDSCAFALSLPILLIGLSCLTIAIDADDSATAPAFDMNALASLASNLGSNPQLMGLVSSFLNPISSSGQKQPFNMASAGGATGSGTQDTNSVLEQDSNSISPAGPEPLRRAVKPLESVSQSQQQQSPAQPQQPQAPGASTMTSAPAVAVQPAPAPASNSNPLSGLISMLPGIVSGLGGSAGAGAGGGLASLGGLLSGLTRTQPVPSPVSTGASSDQSAATFASNGQAKAATSLPASAPASGPAPLSPSASPAGPGASPAQSVITQVLTAYVAGQIPNELIQLGLSGRVPPQIIELALSGQVPPQMIQMIITGQVPMSTINSFLSAMQGVRSVEYSTGGNTASGSITPSATQTGPSNSSPGVFSTTRALFEAMFGLNKKSLNGNKSPLGAMLKLPSMPNVRSLGQMVGGTITNVASMLPF